MRRVRQPSLNVDDYPTGKSERGLRYGAINVEAPALVGAGFTLIELVVILVIVGVLAVAAIPRFFDRQLYDARGFYDQALSMARYGQKVAIAQHKEVFFNADAPSNTICLTYVADATCPNPTNPPGSNDVVNPADGKKFSKTAPSGVTLSASTSFSFSALGKPSPDAPVSFDIVSSGMTRNITVERETGYVH